MLEIPGLVSGLVLLSPPVAAGNLEKQLQSLGLRSAIVVPSQAVDEQPVWSPDGRFLAANIDGRWIRVDLATLRLTSGRWNDGEPVAVPGSESTSQAIEESEAKAWRAKQHFGPRTVTSNENTEIALTEVDLGTALTIKPAASPAITIWTTKLENCHSLALAPDESLVACICELSGVLVTSLRP